MKKGIAVVALTLSIFAAEALFGQSAEPEGEMEDGAVSENFDSKNVFGSWDSDGDQRLDENEFSKGVKAFFVDWDTNEDGSLNRREWKKRVSQNYGFREYEGSYGEWDLNGDEMLDGEEFASGIFSVYDDNADGYVDSDEYQRWSWDDDTR